MITHTLDTMPDAQTASIEALAAWYATNGAEVEGFASALRKATSRLREAVRDQGPIITPAGRVYLESYGSFEYPPDIAQEFPGLGRHIITATVDTIEQAERVLSLVNEEVPLADLNHEMKVDGKRAAAQIAKGGEAAHRLLDMRIAKSKLAVG